MAIGNGLDESVQIGPLVNQDAVEKSHEHVRTMNVNRRGFDSLWGGTINES